MKNEEKIYKEFKKIRKRKENEGYVDWKQSVLSEISGYSKDSLTNLMKRYEIEYAMLDEKKEISNFHLMSVMIPLLAVSITAVISCFSSSMSNQISIVNGIKTNISDSTKYINDLVAVLSSGYSEMLNQCCYFICIIVLLIWFVHMCSNLFYKKETTKKVFYKELLLILNEQLAN